MGQDKNIPRQGGSGMKDNQHLMQTPEKLGMGGMVGGRGGPNDIMGGPSPTGERLSAILAGQGNPNQFDGMNQANRKFSQGSLGSGLSVMNSGVTAGS